MSNLVSVVTATFVLLLACSTPGSGPSDSCERADCLDRDFGDFQLCNFTGFTAPAKIALRLREDDAVHAFVVEKVKAICDSAALSCTFAMEPGNVTGAVIRKSDSGAYLVYSRTFISTVRSAYPDAADWILTAILAHEVGHLAAGHPGLGGANRHSLENEADKFAAATIRAMGATRNQASLFIEVYTNEDLTPSHPPRSVRRETFNAVFPAGPIQRYFRDNDGDGFGDKAHRVEREVQPEGYVPNDEDCCDNDAEARPGQLGFFNRANHCGHFDFNCDGQVNRKIGKQTGKCGTPPACNHKLAGKELGWLSSPPECGAKAQYMTDCVKKAGVFETDCVQYKEERTETCQ